MANLKEKDTKNLKCANCGDNLVFDPKTGGLACRSCGSKVELKTEKPKPKKDFSKIEKEFQSWNKESSLVRCENCGAKEVVSDKTISHNCSFCGSNKIVEAKDLPGLKPDAVLPFSITSKVAEQSYKKWIKGKMFAPNDLKKKAKLNSFNGVYTPSWSFDTNVHTDYKGTLEKDENYRDSQGRIHTRTKVKRVKGSRDDKYIDYLMSVGQKIDRVTFNKIQPFNLKDLKVYSHEYLAGFVSNHYDITAKESWKSAKRYMTDDIKRKIVRYHHADRERHLELSQDFKDIKYSYFLLPVWVASYNYKEKLYNFFVNGTTGEVSGKTPVSPIKVALAIIFAVLIFALFIMIGEGTAS